MSEIIIHPVTGSAILPYRHALAELRIAVFREWPYLYEGSLDYEQNYLKHYADCPESVVALAMEGERVIGASTGLPMSAADHDFQKAFAGSDFAIDDIYYFGESVLRSEYRGRGIGRSFFEARETQARNCGARYAAFCAVDRSADDPRRPAEYRPLDGFWNKLHYRKYPEIQAQFEWKEIGKDTPSQQTLSFWLKPL